jgi:hypothetical protein
MRSIYPANLQSGQAIKAESPEIGMPDGWMAAHFRARQRETPVMGDMTGAFRHVYGGVQTG